MNSGVLFREARRKDQGVIVEFQLEMARETERLKLDPQVVSKGVAEVFESPYRGTYYVAERSGLVIGSLLIIPEWSDWRNGEVWWIHSVFLQSSERGKKIFTAFYQFIKDLCQKGKNTRGLRLYVDKTNAHAQQVYQKLGMTNHHYDLYEWMKPQQKGT